jgi:hypothetical protein
MSYLLEGGDKPVSFRDVELKKEYRSLTDKFS